MSTMRELTTTELNTVAGGCGSFNACHPHPSSCHPQPSHSSCGQSVSLSGMIGAYAGYLAGMYNVAADYFNHASCSTISSAWQNVGADMQLGYTAGKSMSVSGAMSLLQNTISSIQGAQTYGNCGCLISATTITFPPITGGGLG